ncbi:unnamed protein product [Alternaria alternata]
MADKEPCNVLARNRIESQPTTLMRRELMEASLEQNETFPDHGVQPASRTVSISQFPVAGSAAMVPQVPPTEASQQASLQTVPHILSKLNIDHYLESKAKAVKLEQELLVLNRKIEELTTIIEEQDIKYESELHSELDNQEHAIAALKKRHEDKFEKKRQSLREQMTTKLQARNTLNLERMRDSISVEDLRECISVEGLLEWFIIPTT